MLRLSLWNISIFSLAVVVFVFLLGQKQIKQSSAAGCLVVSGSGTQTFYGDQVCLVASGDTTAYVYGNVNDVSFVASGNTTIHVYGNVVNIDFTTAGDTVIYVHGNVSGSIDGTYTGSGAVRACSITGTSGGVPPVDVRVNASLCPTPTPTRTPTPTLTPTPVPEEDEVVCPINPTGKIIINFPKKGLRSDKTQDKAESDVISASIPSGNYKVTLVSYDGHSEKDPPQIQLYESWYLKLRDASSAIVAVSDAISDLPDTQDWLTEQVNADLAIYKNITSVTAFHAAYPDSDPNSIRPVCAAFQAIGPTFTPAPTQTPTPAPPSCSVRTVPTTHNLSIGDTGNITASVISGQGAASIVRMRFGSYNSAVATVSPTSDSTSPYSTTVTAIAGGSTAVWATADLSDGRTCQSNSFNDTDVNVSGSTPIPTSTPTPTLITPAPTAILYTINGNVFSDVNKNLHKDGGESNITGAVVQSSGGIVVMSNGYYEVQNLPAGTYTISYTSALPVGFYRLYPNGFPPRFINVRVGPGCSVDTTTGASCTAADNIVNLDFAITNSRPWIQTYGLDIRVDDGFTNIQPAGTTCGGGSYLSGTIPGYFDSPGIIFTGNGTASLGQGSASSKNWVVGGTFYPEVFNNTIPLKTSIQSLLKAAARAGITPTELQDCSGGCNLPSQKGFYHVLGSMKLDKNENFNNGNYVFVSDGVIRITNGKRIRVNPGSTVIFSARDIIIDSSISAPNNISCAPQAQLEGIYSADHDIIIEGNNGNCSLGADKMLNVEGTLIANAARTDGEFTRRRDLCADNLSRPSITIKARPDFILNIPGFLTQQNFVFYEETP